MPKLLHSQPCPSCGTPMHTRISPLAVCQHCARIAPDGLPVGWPSLNGGLDLPASCPQCIELPRSSSCCTCHGTRIVRIDTLTTLGRNIWARLGCDCEACRYVGKAPSGLQDVTLATPPPMRPVVTPIAVQQPLRSPFAEGFRRRERAS